MVKLFRRHWSACVICTASKDPGEITAGHLLFDQEGDLKLVGLQAKMKAADETMAPNSARTRNDQDPGPMRIPAVCGSGTRH